MTKFGTVTQVGDKHISRGQPRPHPKVAGPLRCQFLGPLPTPKLFDAKRPNLVW